MEGDIQLGMQIKQLFDSLDIDWEGFIAAFTGDAVAHQLAKVTQKVIRKTTSAKTTLHTHMDEYLHHELAILPSKKELAFFYQDVELTMLSVERLEAKVKCLFTKKDSA
jgi:ubiquinone biosynthesis protein UbiJ